MKKVFLVVSAITLTVAAKAVHVPDAIEKAFEQKFPSAKKVKWDKEPDGSYEASFLMQGKEMSATYDASASLLDTETEITVAELPQKVSAAFNSMHPNKKITEAAIIEKANGTIIYEVEAKVNKRSTDFLLTGDGVLIK